MQKAKYLSTKAVSGILKAEWFGLWLNMKMKFKNK